MDRLEEAINRLRVLVTAAIVVSLVVGGLVAVGGFALLQSHCENTKRALDSYTNALVGASESEPDPERVQRFRDAYESELDCWP